MSGVHNRPEVLQQGHDRAIVRAVVVSMLLGLQIDLATLSSVSCLGAEEVAGEPSECEGYPVRELPPELTALACDQEDNLWMGCLYGGLYRFRDGRMTRFDAYNCPIPDSGASAIWIDDNDVKWIGTPRGYVYSFDGKAWKVYAEIKDTIERIRRDGQGRIWLLSDRLRLLRDETAASEGLLEVPRGDGHVGIESPVTMDVDRAGHVWVGTLSGLVRCDGSGWQHPDDENQVGRDIRDIWCDRRSGAVYVAALSGYHKYDQGKWTVLSPPGPAGGAASGTIHGSEGGLVGVIHHLGRGAAVLHEGKWLSLGKGTPLENDWLKGVATDKTGRFWFIGRWGGLRSFDGEDWTAYPVSKNILAGTFDPRLVWRQSHLSELMEKEATEVDIRKVIQNPRPFFGKQIRFTGRIESSFEYANFLDADGERLDMWPDIHQEFYAFLRESGLEDEFDSAKPKEFTGYLEFGGYFGHMGGWARQFFITEMYTVSGDAPAKSTQKQQLSDYLDRIRRNRWIRPDPTNEEVREAKRALQGDWRLESANVYGRSRTVSDGEGIVFSNGNLVFHAGGSANIARYEVDPSLEPPAIDQFSVSEDDAAATRTSLGLHRRRQKGIYRIDGDRLTICLGKTDLRPLVFEAREEPGTTLLVLRRVDRLETKEPGPDLAPAEALSRTNLLRLARAIHNYADRHGHFPPAVCDAPLDNPANKGTQPHSWRVALLPFLGHRDLFDKYDFAEPWDGPNNRKLLSKMPAVFRHPTASPDVSDTAYFLFTGPGTVQDGNKAPRLRDVVDGTSNTAHLAEVSKAVPWTKPEDISYAPEEPIPTLGGYYDNRFFLGLVDGSTVLLRNDVEERMLRALLEKADGRAPNWRSFVVQRR